jgi:2-phosphoglycerate kinase
VVEGVHLNMKNIQKLAKRFPQVIPFMICIKSESKHKERFAVRSKHMTLDPRFNKYIKYFKNIRTIAKFLVKKAEACLVPRIDNSNVDKSIGTIHSTVVRSLRKIDEGEKIFDQGKFVTLH